MVLKFVFFYGSVVVGDWLFDGDSGMNWCFLFECVVCGENCCGECVGYVVCERSFGCVECEKIFVGMYCLVYRGVCDFISW